MDEDVALAYMARGLVVPIGKRNAIRQLRWLGTPLQNVTTPEEAAGYKPSEARPTVYVYDYESPNNIKNFYELKRLPKSTRPIFRKSITDCIAPFFDPDRPELNPDQQTHETP